MKEKEERTVVRFDNQFIWQHILLMVSVTLLALTGLALMYYDSWLSRALIFLEGGMEARGFIHRVSAVMLIGLMIYHAIYILLTRRGHDELMELLPTIKDFKDYGMSIKYGLGKSEKKPRIGRYGYREKFQYWTLAIVSLLLTVSGLILWFHNWALASLPKWAIDISFVVHGSSGVFLFLFLLVWHMYEVHLTPSKFPGSLSFLDGKITEREFMEEHPLEYEKKGIEGEDE